MGLVISRMALCALIVGISWTADLPQAQARNKHLAKAKKAYDDLQYGRVLPLLDKALKIADSADEEVEIYHLMAIIHATYNRDAKSEAAFIEVLRRQPDFELSAETSPKIRESLEAARAQGPFEPLEEDGSGGTDRPPTGPRNGDAGDGGDGADGGDEADGGDGADGGGVNDSLVKPVDPLMPGVTYRRRGPAFYTTWWFWTVVGVIAVGGAGYATYAMTRSEAPSYDLGPVPLQ